MFNSWRKLYLRVVMKKNLNEISYGFRREKNLKKYFSKMLNVFYSL